MATLPPDLIPDDIATLYEVHNYRSAAQVLATSCKEEFDEIIGALRKFRLTLADIRKPGGNESDIPKKISELLRKESWKETRIKGDLLIQKVSGSGGKKIKKADPSEAEEESETLETIEELKRQGYEVERIVRENFLDGHKVDHVKGRVAFDMEWNSKDQTFDRDLYAFRAFHECDLIDAAILLTRSASLNDVFDKLGSEQNEDRHSFKRHDAIPYKKETRMHGSRGKGTSAEAGQFSRRRTIPYNNRFG